MNVWQELGGGICPPFTSQLPGEIWVDSHRHVAPEEALLPDRAA